MQHKYIVGSQNAEVEIYHVHVYSEEELHAKVIEAFKALADDQNLTGTTEKGLALEVAQWLYKHSGFTQRKRLRIQAETRWNYDHNEGYIAY